MMMMQSAFTIQRTTLPAYSMRSSNDIRAHSSGFEEINNTMRALMLGRRRVVAVAMMQIHLRDGKKKRQR